MGSRGYYLSKTRIIILVVVVAVLLLFVGLMAGLVGRPNCSTVTSTEPPSTTSSTEETTAETTPAPTEPPGPWSNIRLSENLVPTKYDIDIRPILEPDENGVYKFFGSSSVTYTCMNATNYVIMHSNKLNYTKNQVTLKEDGADFTVKNMMFYAPNEYVVLETEQPCTEGKTYIFTVTDFVSELSDDLNGIYRSEYDTKDGVHKVIATSQMQVTGARETFPCFDEPALKANFTVRLWYRANTGYYALSNMPPASYRSETKDGNLWNSTLFEETVPMSTYLLGLLVVDFSYEQTSTQDNISTRIYARKEVVDNGEAIYASKITPKILEYFEDYFNVPYPLPKSDQVAVPDFSAGAMENWGIVIYRETYLLYNDAVSSVFDQEICTNVVAHELAHMWFGNLVSPAWWDDLWLNEGFATYVSYLGMDNVQPTWKSSTELFLIRVYQGAMEVDGLTSSHPLVQTVNTNDEIYAQFDIISYNKGSSILKMINGFMNETNFVGGLTKYLNDFSYRAAAHGDLFRHWKEQADNTGLNFPASLVTILETWTLQMGYPVVNVKKDTDTDIYRISQDYFLFDDNATWVQTPGSRTYGYKWYVPLTYKSSSQIGTDQVGQMWLKPNEESEITESDYLLANIDAVGYYRVNYDASTWEKLITKLKSDTFTEISTSNRAQLIDDAFNLARPGILDINVGMDMSKYLTQESEYVPWRTFVGRIRFIEYLIGRSKIYGAFSNYIVNLIKPLHMKLGWEEPNKDDSGHLGRMTVQLAIRASCYHSSKDCIANATRLYSEWMNDPENTAIISNTYRDEVYCTAIRNGGVDEWDFAWERHNATFNAQEKQSLRYGMACSREIWILKRYIDYCADRTYVRRQDGWSTCLRFIAGQEYGRDLVWSFVAGNWDELTERYGGAFSLSSIISVTTRMFSTEYELQQLEAFKSSAANLGSAVRAVDQAIERTRANIRWRELNEAKLATWLENNAD